MPLRNVPDDSHGPPLNERTPLQRRPNPNNGKASSAQTSFMSKDPNFSSGDSDDDEDDDFFSGGDFEETEAMEMRKADRLSRRLLAVDDDDHHEVDRILRQSLKLHKPLLPSSSSATELGFYPSEEVGKNIGGTPGTSFSPQPPLRHSGSVGRFSLRNSGRFRNMLEDAMVESQEKARRRIFVMLGMAAVCVCIIVLLAYFEVTTAQPPSQPVGPYVLLERQEGDDFFAAYEFYEGPDSVGSNGYNNYVSQSTAQVLGMVNVTYEDDVLDVYGGGRRHRRRRRLYEDKEIAEGTSGDEDKRTSPISEPFVYMRTVPTADGPRQSIRLEGIRRFNRGLFILDVRHMPAGCGVWPAFWLTDEANWPVNGEIDIVEGVNYQSTAKTALHSTKGCHMYDIPLGTMTGSWDTAVGIPDVDTGIPDMTMRYARNCFVYDPHQWLNQGCVAVDLQGGTMGQPLNAKGGGVYALGKFMTTVEDDDMLMERVSANRSRLIAYMKSSLLWLLTSTTSAVQNGTQSIVIFEAGSLHHMKVSPTIS